MSIPALGHKSNLLIAKEATYGTAPAAATAKYDFENFSWDASQSAIADPNINSSGMSPRDFVQGLQSASLSYRVAVGFEGFEEMFRFLMGSYSSALVGGESLVRDHTYKEGTALNSYTFDPSFGDVPVGKVTRFSGVYCTGWRLNIVAGRGGDSMAVLDVTAAVNGAPLDNTTPMTGTPAVLNVLKVPFHMLLRTAGNLKDGSGLAETAIYLNRLGITVTYPHDTERAYLGGLWADSPVRNGNMLVTIECEAQIDATNYVLMQKLLTNAAAAGGLKFLFQHPTTIGNASKRELEFSAAAPQAGGYGQAIQGPGVITQKFTWALRYDATDLTSIKIRNRNLTAALA